MSFLKDLKAASERRDLADLLGIKLGMLTYAIYKTSEAERYTSFTIPKRHGGTREILAPNGDLKLIQRRLATLLQNCVDEINVSRGHIENGKRFGIAHGFKRKHTIMTNARVHMTRRFVFNADLQDFFGTINFGRVRGFFLKDKNFALHPNVATVIAQIACFSNKLPQGSPCSPVISNLIAHPLDIRLSKLAKKAGVTYTRYADDLTFSTNKPEFPAEIASPSSAHAWDIGTELANVVNKNGFEFNATKTRLQYRDSRQEVTGLTVNRKVNVPAAYRNRVRAMVHKLFQTGNFEFVYKKVDAEGKVDFENRVVGTNAQLLGMLSFIDQVDYFNQKICADNETTPQEPVGRTAMFRRFLYFDFFFAAQKPIIVCEGKTDNVYLRCAIRSLGSAYPQLVDSDEMKVRFFKYTESRTGKIMDLTGGVGGICKLMKSYQDDIKGYFKAPISNNPVIILIDNDSGANSIYEAIAGITKKPKPKGMGEFIHVVGNLYVVPTPLGPGGTQTAIEDFFDEPTLSTELKSKKFNRKNKNVDTDEFYGKAAFARDVIAANASTVDFNRFTRILDRVVAVLDDYKNKKIP